MQHRQRQKRIVVCQQGFIPMPVVSPVKPVIRHKTVCKLPEDFDHSLIGRITFQIMANSYNGIRYAPDGFELCKIGHCVEKYLPASLVISVVRGVSEQVTQ